MLRPRGKLVTAHEADCLDALLRRHHHRSLCRQSCHLPRQPEEARHHPQLLEQHGPSSHVFVICRSSLLSRQDQHDQPSITHTRFTVSPLIPLRASSRQAVDGRGTIHGPVAPNPPARPADWSCPCFLSGSLARLEEHASRGGGASSWAAARDPDRQPPSRGPRPWRCCGRRRSRPGAGEDERRSAPVGTLVYGM